MNLRKPLKYGVLLCGIAVVLSNAAFPQAIRVNRRIVARPDTPVSSLSISVSPTSVDLTLVANGVSSSGAVNVTTSWSSTVCSGSCTVNLYAWFANPSAALSGGSPVVDIPSSEVLGKVSTGLPTNYTAFTQSPSSGGLGVAGATLELFSQSMSSHARRSSRTDALDLEVNLTNQKIPAGTYNGTLYIQAETF